MTNNITMTHTGGPYGDECSSYKFTLNREMTLKEFAEMIAVDKREWGYISLGFNNRLVDYKRGEIRYKPDVSKDIIIAKEGTAHGGWSRMDYYIKLADGGNK